MATGARGREKELARFRARLGHDLASELEAIQRHTPRFLFRGFHNMSGGRFNGLNTESAIVPHAFLRYINGSRVRPRDCPTNEKLSDFNSYSLVANVSEHLSNSEDCWSEFTSWSMDPLISLFYAGYQPDTTLRPDCILAVIDTKKLDRKLEILHTPALASAIRHHFPRADTNYYYEEYLVHGPVKGHGLHATEVMAFADNLFKYLNEPDQRESLVTLEHITLIKRAALCFGTQHGKRQELFVFLVVSLLAGIQSFFAEDVDTILQVLADESLGGLSAKIPASFVVEDWIMTDEALIENAPDSQVTITMLRALVYRQFGAKAIRALKRAAACLESVQPEPEFSSYAAWKTVITERDATAGTGTARIVC